MPDSGGNGKIHSNPPLRFSMPNTVPSAHSMSYSVRKYCLPHRHAASPEVFFRRVPFLPESGINMGFPAHRPVCGRPRRSGYPGSVLLVFPCILHSFHLQHFAGFLCVFRQIQAFHISIADALCLALHNHISLVQQDCMVAELTHR